jgi:hypothetical protein
LLKGALYNSLDSGEAEVQSGAALLGFCVIGIATPWGFEKVERSAVCLKTFSKPHTRHAPKSVSQYATSAVIFAHAQKHPASGGACCCHRNPEI